MGLALLVCGLGVFACSGALAESNSTLIGEFPKEVQDAVFKELGENPAILNAEKREEKGGIEYTVTGRTPENKELRLCIQPTGYVLLREISGITVEELPEAVRATAEKELGGLKPGDGVKIIISKRIETGDAEYKIRKENPKGALRLDVLEKGIPLKKVEEKDLADLPQAVQDTINKETIKMPAGATVQVELVDKATQGGKLGERFYTADVRGKGLAVALKIGEYGNLINREEKDKD